MKTWHKRTTGILQWPEKGTFDVACCKEVEANIKHYKAKETSNSREGKRAREREVLRWFRDTAKQHILDIKQMPALKSKKKKAEQQITPSAPMETSQPPPYSPQQEAVRVKQCPLVGREAIAEGEITGRFTLNWDTQDLPARNELSRVSAASPLCEEERGGVRSDDAYETYRQTTRSLEDELNTDKARTAYLDACEAYGQKTRSQVDKLDPNKAKTTYNDKEMTACGSERRHALPVQSQKKEGCSQKGSQYTERRYRTGDIMTPRAHSLPRCEGTQLPPPRESHTVEDEVEGKRRRAILHEEFMRAKERLEQREREMLKNLEKRWLVLEHLEEMEQLEEMQRHSKVLQGESIELAEWTTRPEASFSPLDMQLRNGKTTGPNAQQTPLRQMPLVTKGRNQIPQYTLWSFCDMIGLAGRLPDLNEGANKWITALEESTAGVTLALGDIKALLMHMAGTAATEEVFKGAHMPAVLLGNSHDPNMGPAEETIP
eukprot:superscaffoldBa00009313_g24013